MTLHECQHTVHARKKSPKHMYLRSCKISKFPGGMPPDPPDNEGVTNYMAELCKLVKTCMQLWQLSGHGTTQSTRVRAEGFPRIQRKLLCMQKLTVAQVLERARAMEAVANEAKHLQFEGLRKYRGRRSTHSPNAMTEKLKWKH